MNKTRNQGKVTIVQVDHARSDLKIVSLITYIISGLTLLLRERSVTTYVGIK
jgi:hypothetical protein